MILLLFIFWIIFSGYFEFYFLSAGLLSLFLVVIITGKFFPQSRATLFMVGFRLSWLRFFIKLLREIFSSSIKVSKIIWSKKIEIEPEEGYVDCSYFSENKKVIYANSITLTPGTMTLKLEDGQIFVHAIDKSFMEDLRNGGLTRIIEEIK